MNAAPLQRTVIITNPHGFHMRPMSAFVQLASRFESSVKVSSGEKVVDGKSMFDLMLLAAGQGSALTVETNGPDAEAALDALVALLKSPLQEEESPEDSG
jgi:phosphotransferase system HPr (HPr) family protein